MAITDRRTVYTLDDLPALLENLKHPSTEEIRQRQKWVDEVLALRATMPPLGINAADIVSEQREISD